MRKNYISIPLFFIIANCTQLPMSLAVKKYKMASVDNLKYDSGGGVIKIYLVSQEKRSLEKNLGKSIPTTNNCDSSYYENSRDLALNPQKRIWSQVENKVFDLSKNHKLPISFVFSQENADYIFEYSFGKTTDYQILTLFTLPFHIALLGIPPLASDYKYEIIVSVINARSKKLVKSNKDEFSQWTVTSSVLLPFSPLIEPKNNNVANIQIDTITKIIIGKTIEYSEYLIGLEKK